MNSYVEGIKKLHAEMAIERKDLNLEEYVKENIDKKTGIAVMDVIGLASKFVPKYKKPTNAGYHTMIYLADGRKTGCFSNALFDFAKFFYDNSAMDSEAEFNKVMFTGSLKVGVSVVPLEQGKSTYNFEIIEGDMTGLARSGRIDGATPIMLSGSAE